MDKFQKALRVIKGLFLIGTELAEAVRSGDERRVDEILTGVGPLATAALRAEADLATAFGGPRPDDER